MIRLNSCRFRAMIRYVHSTAQIKGGMAKKAAVLVHPNRDKTNRAALPLERMGRPGRNNWIDRVQRERSSGVIGGDGTSWKGMVLI